MKKILFLGGLGCGGAESQMTTIAALLSNDNYDITFIYSGDEEYCASNLCNTNVKLTKISVPSVLIRLKLSYVYLFCRVYKIVVYEKISTIISFLDVWNLLACSIAAISGKRVKAIIGIRNARSDKYTSFKGKINSSMNKYASAIVSNSHCAIDTYKKYLKHDNVSFHTIYNIVKPLHILSKYIPLVNEKTHICISASYRDVKNPYRLIEAVHMLTQDEQSRLSISWYGNIAVTDSIVYNKMYTLIKTYELEDCIKLYDATDQIADKMYQSDFVGLFSTSEGLPNSICEAMSLGKPVIMTRVSDYKILVKENISGFLCDPLNPTSIASALRMCISKSKEDIRCMGIEAKRMSDRLFATSSILEEWKNLI